MADPTAGPTVTVTPWGTPPSASGAQYHDCLWEIALEQATLERMGRTGEDFETAKKNVPQEDIARHLDTICKDNGFRPLGGGGSGRNPNLIYTGNEIKVRIDPKKLTEAAPGVDNPQTGDAYTNATRSDTGPGADVVKKEKLDNFLKTVPGYESLPPDLKAAWIEAYARDGVDPTKLTQLTKADGFKDLDAATQTRLLRMYGQKDQGVPTAEINKMLAAPGTQDKERLLLMGTGGFSKLDAGKQRRLLERYDSDPHFKAAIDEIVKQGNFTDKSDTAQAHALDILYRYAGRKHSGYGYRDESNRRLILVTLYNDKLSKPEFNLEASGGPVTPETPDQTKTIDDFANKTALGIRDNKK